MKFFTPLIKPTYSLKQNRIQGFTLVEILVTIAILAVISVIALPNINTFLVKMRVDNAISETHRLILIARNTAINTGKNTTLCALKESNGCGGDWGGEISVFANGNGSNTSAYNATTDQIIKVKAAVKNDDTLTFAHARIIYSPTGRLISNNAGTFRYCPKGYEDESRGIDVATSGRAYISSDTDNDQKDEDRAGNEISCD